MTIYFFYQLFILFADIASRAYVRHAYIQRLHVRSEIIISWVSFPDCVCANQASLEAIWENTRDTRLKLWKLASVPCIGVLWRCMCMQSRRWQARRGLEPPRGEKQRTYMENTSGIICHFDAIRPAENAEPRFTDVYLSDFTGD